MAVGAADRLGRRGEAGQNPVARRLDQHAVVARQQPLHVDVELVEHAAPLSVAGRGRPHRRVHDVGEQDGGRAVRVACARPVRPVTNSSISSTMESNSPAQGTRSAPGMVTNRAPAMCSARYRPCSLRRRRSSVRRSPGSGSGCAGRNQRTSAENSDEVECHGRRRAGAAPCRPPPPLPEADPVGQAGGEDHDVLGHPALDSGHVDAAPRGRVSSSDTPKP